MGKAIVVPDIVFEGVGNKKKVTCNKWVFNGYELVSCGFGNHTFMQGVAVVDNFAIHFSNDSDIFYVYDLVNKRQVQQTTFQEADINRHSNCLNFGTKKYDESDEFPLLYGSGYEANEGGGNIQKTVDVYRVQRNNGVWSITRVQVIDYSGLSSGIGYTNACIWGDSLCLVPFSGYNCYEFECPDVPEGDTISTYNLTDEDLVKVHYNVTKQTFDLKQGLTCVGNYLYITNSTYNGTIFRHIIDVCDLRTDDIVGHYHLDGETLEIQQISYWQNQDRFILFYRVGSNSKYIDFVRNT